MKIIFIPGLLCTPHVWGELNAVREKYLCHDADVSSFDSIEKMADAIIHHITDEDIALIGFSMGGYVAIEVALKMKNKINKLVLINTTANSVNPATISDRQKAIKFAQRGMMSEILKLSNGISYYKSQKEWLLLEEKMANEVGTESYIRQQNAIIHRNNYMNLIQNICTETLIISGKNDQVISYKDSICMFENISNSNLILLDKCGHLSTLEKSKMVANSIATFLKT